MNEINGLKDVGILTGLPEEITWEELTQQKKTERKKPSQVYLDWDLVETTRIIQSSKGAKPNLSALIDRLLREWVDNWKTKNRKYKPKLEASLDR